MKKHIVTGVFQTNNTEFLYEDAEHGESLNYHESLTQYTEEELENIDNYADFDDYLIGFKKTYNKTKAWYWFVPKEGKPYGFEPDNKTEYSAIVRGDDNNELKRRIFKL